MEIVQAWMCSAFGQCLLGAQLLLRWNFRRRSILTPVMETLGTLALLVLKHILKNNIKSTCMRIIQHFWWFKCIYNITIAILWSLGINNYVNTTKTGLKCALIPPLFWSLWCLFYWASHNTMRSGSLCLFLVLHFLRFNLFCCESTLGRHF